MEVQEKIIPHMQANMKSASNISAQNSVSSAPCIAMISFRTPWQGRIHQPVWDTPRRVWNIEGLISQQQQQLSKLISCLENKNSAISRLLAEPPWIMQNVKLVTKTAVIAASPTPQSACHNTFCVCFWQHKWPREGQTCKVPACSIMWS